MVSGKNQAEFVNIFTIINTKNAKALSRENCSRYGFSDQEWGGVGEEADEAIRPGSLIKHPRGDSNARPSA
jgi:hypothetical protein